MLLFYPYNKSMTGGVRHLLSLADCLRASAIEVEILTQTESPLLEESRKRGFPIQHIPLPPLLQPQDGQLLRFGLWTKVKSLLALLGYNYRLYRHLRQEQYSVIWARNIKSVMYIGFAALLSGRPLVWDVGMEYPSRGIVKLLHSLGLLLADKVVTQAASQQQAVFGRTLYRLFKRKFHTISPGIDEERRQELALALNYKTPKSTVFQLISIGIISQRKNQLMLLKSLKRLVADYPGIRLRLVGSVREEAYLQRLQDYIQENGLTPYVALTGWSAAVAELLAESRAFVICSDNEGVPRALREALFAGLPVVGTRAGAIPDAIMDGVNGFLVSLDDVEGLAERLRWLMDHPLAALKMGEASARLGEQRYSQQAWSRQYLALLRMLVPDRTFSPAAPLSVNT
jgi:glycosyltransferase involved in cell wall biosynthesis